ncbi:sulfatase-like hydrolase/transferase [Aporhodopirellula aestuarii]|uniref:Sulfatase-like hydrolase/transferase n=1 Tax=Aporhodopirellula aestuarii TaxID=2950107 RepID=A0ABT0U3W8_9BACT|nr:sulfatase-like hydrolase/transferase [Aporhodopirellula aestuarii]MCM2371568.1 sulfatase-like hydrolase/transferase [Aporhodopirellula aestuarii]
MFLFAVLHPWGKAPLHDGTPVHFGWIVLQCVSLQVPAMVIVGCWNQWRPTANRPVGTLLFAIAPTWFALDVLVFRWSGFHLFTREFASLLREHVPNLLAFFSWGMLLPLFAVVIWLAGGFVVTTLTARLVNPAPTPRLVAGTTTRVVVTLGMLAGLLLLATRPTSDELFKSVREHPSRYPWTALRDYHSTTAPIQPFQYDRNRLADVTHSRIQQMRMNVVTQPAEITSPAKYPDVLIIVCESLRPEMLDPAIMPHADAASRSGLRLNHHYSGGNATSLGMFSIFSGLEAVWFYKSEMRFAPSLNRLFHQTGYELGFFAGHDDWGTFQMDAFVSPRHFDQFTIEPMDWLASDRRAIAAAESFLAEAPDTQRPPRLAVLFLYSTHAPFAVEPSHSIDRPAATADYPIPFPSSWRPSVWNRYRNAARTLDAELASLIHDDRITVVTGDHGESFLDDDTIGHGTRLSESQMRVPAFITGPNVPAMETSDMTMHADLLPTILSAAGIQTSMPNQLDGLDLLSASNKQLRSRIFSVSNLVGRDMMLLTPGVGIDGVRPRIRVRFSLLDQTAVPLGHLNEMGELLMSPMQTVQSRGDEALSAWLRQLAR